MKLELTWPHNVLINFRDPEITKPQMERWVTSCLMEGRNLIVAAKDRSIIIPIDLLRTAVIDIKQ